MPINVAVIGMGPIGNRHAKIYADNPKVNLVALCERDPVRNQQATNKFHLPCYSTIEELFSSQEIQLCSVATGGYEYGSDHAKPAMFALEHGAHVLSEKPISNSIPDAYEMVQTADRFNKILAVNLNHRFTPAARVAKTWQSEGKIGTPLFINMSIWIHNPNESSPFFHIKALHPHSVDIMRHFFGDIEQVHCFAMKGPNRKIWSNAQFNIKFKDGAVGSLTGSYDIQRGHPMERCEFAGINGRVVIDDMYREATLYPAGNLVKSVYTNPIFGGMESFTDTFVNRINQLVDEIEEGVAPENIDGTGLDGLKAQIVLEAAVQSIIHEKVVRTDDILKI